MSMMKTLSALLALCEWNPPVTGGFPKGPIILNFDVTFFTAEQAVEQTVKLPAI